jgi:hypothetical protein
MTRGDPPQKLSSLIRAAERFRPLHKFMGVESVRKIITGLEYGQQLLRKMMITVTGAKLLHLHSVSPFSPQPLTPFEVSGCSISPWVSRVEFEPINLCMGRKRSAA